MKRTAIHLEEVCAWDNLAWAFWRSARGKRYRPEVQRFGANLTCELQRLQREILDGSIELGNFDRFEIVDPKRRTIHAPCFRERVLHHALMAKVEPVFERFLVDVSYACRAGKGSWAAVQRAQVDGRRWPWTLKFDVKSYFASIDHGLLKSQIRRRIKGRRVLELVERIIEVHETSPGKGLPIGALTSQHFANLYLAPLDRFLLEELRLPGMVRYMDDAVVWHGERSRLREVIDVIVDFAARELLLTIKPTWQLQRSERGLSLCGYRIYPARLGLTARRRRRYRQVRQRWEGAYAAGKIGAESLQSGYAAALAITQGTDSGPWRRCNLITRPAPEA